jgi:uncharacterized protein
MEDQKVSPEEEYFARKNKEAIDKLREKMKIAAQAKEAGLSSMSCPRCDGTLKEIQFEGALIDTCDKCAGVWLDSGELETIIKKDKNGWFSRLWFSEG